MNSEGALAVLPSWVMRTRAHSRAVFAVSLVAVLAAGCTGSIRENVSADDDASGNPANAGSSGASLGSPGTGGTNGGGRGSGGTNPSGTSGGFSGSGGSGTSGSSGSSSSADPGAFGTCPSGTPDPGVTPLSKLSTVQYRNTVVDLLRASGLDDLVDAVTPLLEAVPDDSTQASFRGLDKRISSDHLGGYFNVASTVGNLATADAKHLTALAGTCATQSSLAKSCLDAFLAEFGKLALRHPLTSDELAEFEDVAQGSSPAAATPAEALRNVVVTLLMSPRFVNHLELDGAPVSGRDDYLALSPHEIAARLSYTFWQTMPDAELTAAADDGSLATDDGFEQELSRVFEDPRTQQTIWQFWNEWLRFEAFTGFASERPAFRALAEGEHVGEQGHDHWGDMVQEIRDLTELYTWKQSGTLAELLTSNLSVTRSADLAHLYGVKTWSGSGSYPTLPDGTRSGLLTRSALLASSLETTNPFHRGALIRRAILCEDLPQPDPTSLPPGSLDPPPASETETTRARYQAKIEGNHLCLGCHTTFSNIGYTFEAYDSLGRFRSEEKVFDEQTGELIATLPLDTTASVQIGDEPASDVDGPLALNQRIVDSGKVEACLSANYFRYALRREPEANSADACAFEDMRAALGTAGLGLADVFRKLAAEPAFRARKVGAP